MASIARLRSQVPAGVFAAGSDPTRLTWRVEDTNASAVQEAYEVEASQDAGFERALVTTGVVERADQVAVPAPGDALASRKVRYYRVRIRTEAAWTAWSEPLRVEAGLLDGGAKFTRPPPEHDERRRPRAQFAGPIREVSYDPGGLKTHRAFLIGAVSAEVDRGNP